MLYLRAYHMFIETRKIVSKNLTKSRMLLYIHVYFNHYLSFCDLLCVGTLFVRYLSIIKILGKFYNIEQNIFVFDPR